MRRGVLAGSHGLMPEPTRTSTTGLTIEAITSVDPHREFRIHPRDRVVAYTADVGGARQLFTVPLRGGAPTQLTASSKPVGDPQWSPDGRRLAFIRDDELWVIEADGSRSTRVVAKPGGAKTGRWSPDGRRLAFLSRRRGWSQIWLIDAPVPRRGRPANSPKPPEATVLTETGIDVDDFQWSPDGTRLAVMARRRADDLETAQIALVDVATGATQVVAGEASLDTGARWMPDGSLLYVSDADGWFQVVRLTADGHDRIVLTAGEREHGEPSGGVGYAPLPSPDGTRFVHVEVHDGLCDLVVGDLAGSVAPKRGRGRPPKVPRTVAAAGAGRRINPWDGVWRSVGWLSDGAWIAAVGDSETRSEDLWLLPVPGVAPEDARPRRVTDSMPAVLGAALATGRVPAGERVGLRGPRRPAPRGHALASRAGDRQARRPARPDDRLPARRPDLAVVPELPALQAAPGRGRVRLPRHRLPRLHRLRPGVPPRQPRRVGPRRPQRRDRRRPLGRRAAVVRRPPRGVRRLVRRLPRAQRPRRGARACGAPGSTSSATPRSPRASATATGPAGSTSSG